MQFAYHRNHLKHFVLNSEPDRHRVRPVCLDSVRGVGRRCLNACVGSFEFVGDGRRAPATDARPIDQRDRDTHVIFVLHYKCAYSLSPHMHRPAWWDEDTTTTKIEMLIGRFVGRSVFRSVRSSRPSGPHGTKVRTYIVH